MEEERGDTPPLLCLKVHPSVKEALEGDWYKDGHFERLCQALGRPPSLTTIRINTLRCDSQGLMAELRKQFQPTQDGKEQGESNLSLLERLQPHQSLFDVITLPCTGPHGFPSSYPPVVVDQACGEAVLRGADVFAPGVLGAASGINFGDKVSVFVDIYRTITQGEAVVSGGERLFVGNGIAQLSRGGIFSKQSGVAVKMTEKLYSTPPLNGVLVDKMFLQNLPSMVVAHVLEPQEGEFILDMCTAPGGKVTHVAALTSNRAHITALEKSENKVKGVKALCDRLGITSVNVIAYDATKALKGGDRTEEKMRTGKEASKVEKQGEEKGLFPPEYFDRVLLDPPCSGLGNRPRLKDDQSWKTLQGHAVYQRKLVYTAVDLLKPGGTLVYSTCTINPLENEEMVRFILDHYKGTMTLEKQHPYLGSPGLATTSLNEEERSLVQRFDPTEMEEMTGFFIAKFKKAPRAT